jgi:hypothetical protein
MEDQMFDSIMKSFLAQLNSSLKISKIISEHGGEEELSEDSIVCGLVYRLMTPMDSMDINESIETANEIYDDLLCGECISDCSDDDISEDIKPIESSVRKIKSNNCNCEICIQARVCLLNYNNHEPKDHLELMYKNAIENACEKSKLYI